MLCPYSVKGLLAAVRPCVVRRKSAFSSQGVHMASCMEALLPRLAGMPLVQSVPRVLSILWWKRCRSCSTSTHSSCNRHGAMVHTSGMHLMSISGRRIPNVHQPCMRCMEQDSKKGAHSIAVGLYSVYIYTRIQAQRGTSCGCHPACTGHPQAGGDLAGIKLLRLLQALLPALLHLQRAVHTSAALLAGKQHA